MAMVAHVSLSGTSSQVVWRIRFSITSLRYRLLSFCYVTDDTESRNQYQCSAKHEGTTRAHPDNWKMKVNFFFPRFARTDRRYAPLCTSGRTTPKYLAPALITWLYYIISYICTISASPLVLQPHPNQLWPKREDVSEQQHKRSHRMMSPGTAIQECLSIATVRLLSCITCIFCLYTSEWN